MLDIQKSVRPSSLDPRVLASKGVTHYDQLNPVDRRQIRIDLSAEQVKITGANVCGYCEREIKDPSDGGEAQIEHIKPRSNFPSESLSHENLIVSCQRKKTCGHHKEDRYDATNFICPVNETPNNYFTYDFTGQIHPKSSGNARFEFTYIEALNLNNQKLKDYRGGLIRFLRNAVDNGEPKEVLDRILKDFPPSLKFWAECESGIIPLDED